VYVPNEYTLYLSPQDRKQFDGYEGSLVGELEEYLTEHARREDYALLTPPRVLVTVDDDLAVGEFGIATRMVAAEDAPKRAEELPHERPAETMIYKAPVPAPAPVVPEPEPEPEPEPAQTYTLTMDGKRRELSAERVVLGRSRDCDIRVNDLNVSRRHAEIREQGDRWILVDLGSTNGTLLNGKKIDREQLSGGDTITLGSTEIVFGES
jgi:predicted component of type VI protein secretion system